MIYKEGNEINYDEALELYGFDGLDQIWDDKDCVKYIKKWVKENK